MNDIEDFLFEDLGELGDITSDSLLKNEEAKAIIVNKEDCIIAGVQELKKVFTIVGTKVKINVNDGDFIKSQSIIANIEGSANSILKSERLALNILSRMSGIASETKKLVDICKKINPEIEIAATRKTTPGFRKYEKKAVEIGGGISHRFGLFDAVIIKDNHIKLIGSVKKAVELILENVKNKIIEVEVENEDDAKTVAKLKVDVIMLDNLLPKNAREITKKIKNINPNIIVEISGGINIKNISKYADFADRISIGYLTNSIMCKDFSLEII